MKLKYKVYKNIFSLAPLYLKFKVEFTKRIYIEYCDERVNLTYF